MLVREAQVDTVPSIRLWPNGHTQGGLGVEGGQGQASAA